MIDEKNKGTQNNPSTGTFGANDKTTTGAATASTVDSAKETAKGLIDQAKSTAGQAYGVAAERATTKIEEKKGDLASGLTSVAGTIRQVSSTLRETDESTGVTDTAAKYSDSLAKQIEQISGYFERSDVREMIGDVERFARRNPAVFIGGAFALGFLAARFLKSSSPNQPRRLGSGNYNTPLLKARNDSTKTSNYRGASYDAAGDRSAAEGDLGGKSATGGATNASVNKIDYSLPSSSNTGKSATDFDSGLTDNKTTSGDKTPTNPS